MTILRDVLAELYAMFMADTRLTAAILAVVAVAAAIVEATGLPPLLGGAVLLFGCIGLLVLSVWRAARRRAHEIRAVD